MMILLLIGTILLAVSHSPLWLIASILLVILKVLTHIYYGGTPWRKVFFRIRKMYDIELAKAAAKNPRLTSSRAEWLNFLKRYYKVIYPSLGDDEIQQRFEQFEESITNFSDRSGIKDILQKKFSDVGESTIHRLTEAIESDLTHIDNRLAILKTFVLADIIGRETDCQNRMEFLYTAFVDYKYIDI